MKTYKSKNEQAAGNYKKRRRRHDKGKKKKPDERTKETSIQKREQADAASRVDWRALAAEVGELRVPAGVPLGFLGCLGRARGRGVGSARGVQRVDLDYRRVGVVLVPAGASAASAGTERRGPHTHTRKPKK
jgi:hypothetical protein